jgi:hypothetical protein
MLPRPGVVKQSPVCWLAKSAQILLEKFLKLSQSPQELFLNSIRPGTFPGQLLTEKHLFRPTGLFPSRLFCLINDCLRLWSSPQRR